MGVRGQRVRGQGVGRGRGDGVDDAAAWWRGGEGGDGYGPLISSEVLKPLMREDLERLPDQVCSGWGGLSVRFYVGRGETPPLGGIL